MLTPDEPNLFCEGDLNTTNQELKVYYGGGENAFLAVSKNNHLYHL